MKTRWLCSALLLLPLGLSGCRAQVEMAPEAETKEEVRLGEETDIKLADWLELPREKLADLSDETQDRLENTLKVHRSDAESLPLLPNMRLPLTIPVLHQAKYSQAQEISLPAYLKEGQKDADLALHLARHGDVEAGLKLADPGDKELLEQIEALRTQRNYPLEWTRLVGLTLLEAQLKMATGEVQGATDLVLLHRQLRKLLDSKAAAGPLGADLLPVGLRSLRAAVVAWRESHNRLPVVADQIEQALKDWGEPPAQQPILKPGTPRAAVARLFRDGGKDQILAAYSPAVLRRLLDLQEMPIVGEGVVGAVAFINDKDQLGEMWYVYRSRIGELFPEATHLAHHLIEQEAKMGPVEKSAELARQNCAAGPLVYSFTLTPRSLALGAVLRIADAGAKPMPSRLPDNPLDLGLVDLNRTYERTRFELTPRIEFGRPLRLSKAEVLSQLNVPVGEAKPAEAVVPKVKDADLIDSLSLHWNPGDNMSMRAWPRLLLPLWANYGPCRLEGEQHHLNLIWEQEPARVTFALPYNDAESPDLVWQDTRGGQDQAERLKSAVALEEELRKGRLEAGKPLTSLPRHLHWPTLQLGMSRDQARKELPQDLKGRPAIKTADGSLSMLFTGTMALATATPAQLVLRFGPDDKLAEIRIRYREGPAKVTAEAPSLLEQFKKSCGLPEPLPAPWLGLWTDMAKAKVSPVYYRWQDDRTLLTYQGDAFCLEVILTDCPLDRPQGVALPKLDVCPRGVEGCQLGDGREDVLRRWKSANPNLAPDGGLVLFQPAKSLYDLCLVYFENGKVTRILGRHRAVPAPTTEDFTADLQKLWGADADRLGVVRRIERGPHPETGDPVVRSYSWNDDRTRVQTFAEKSREGQRLFTEWRNWPIPASAATARR